MSAKEQPWTTLITISCANPALRSFWLEIENQLRMTVARCGWDTRACTVKLKEIVSALNQVRELTVDMTKLPHKRFK
jgi:hypothetical protein